MLRGICRHAADRRIFSEDNVSQVPDVSPCSCTRLKLFSTLIHVRLAKRRFDDNTSQSRSIAIKHRRQTVRVLSQGRILPVLRSCEKWRWRRTHERCRMWNSKLRAVCRLDLTIVTLNNEATFRDLLSSTKVLFKRMARKFLLFVSQQDVYTEYRNIAGNSFYYSSYDKKKINIFASKVRRYLSSLRYQRWEIAMWNRVERIIDKIDISYDQF